MTFEVHHYITRFGSTPFTEWFDSLRDRQAQARIQLRLDRLERGLLGDTKFCGDSVWELRIDWGPGYRVYYARSGDALILLLVGGDKRKQQADINVAKGYWRDYQERTKPKKGKHSG